MLRSHATAYTAMKLVPGAEDLHIGLVHHHVEFMPSSPTYWWAKPLAWWGNFWWGRDTVLDFFKSGVFEWHVPLLGRSALPAQLRRLGACCCVFLITFRRCESAACPTP